MKNFKTMVVDINTLWILEYSFSSNYFFSMPLMECIAKNMENFTAGLQTDYVVIGLFKNKEDIEKFYSDNPEIFKGHSIYEDVEGNLKIPPNDK